MSDPFDEVARRLRRDVGEEFRAEAEAGEADAAMAVARGRTLGDVAGDLAARGSTTRVVTRGRQFVGPVVVAGADLIVVRLADRHVAVCLDAVVSLAEVSAPNRASESLPSSSWRKWLHRCEGRPDVELGLVNTTLTEPGLIEAVAVDHVVWRTAAGMHHLAVMAIEVVASR